MQPIVQDMTTGETRRFPCGRYFFLLYAPSGVDLQFFDTNMRPMGSALSVKGGFRTSFDKSDERPVAVEITSLGVQTVRGQYSDIADIDYTRSQGDIDQITDIVNPVSLASHDRNIISDTAILNRVQGAGCFVGGSSASAVSAEYTCMQLFNPVGSSVNILVKSVLVGGSVDEAIQLNIHNSALLSDMSNKVTNKIVGGAAPVGQLRYDSLPSMPGSIVSRLYCGAFDIKEFVNAEPFFLGPGKGLVVFLLKVNTPVAAQFEWEEIAI